MTGRSRWPGVALLLVLLAACEQAGPQPTPSPSPSPAVAAVGALPGILQPPPGPITAGETSAAAQALAAAGARTAGAGSLRMKLEAHVGAPGAARHLDVTGTGEAESAARSHVQVTVDLSGRTISTESVTYDGRSYSRTENDPWRPAAAGSAVGDPRRYLNFVSGARGVVDAGAGQRNGMAAEEYRATADASTSGNQPAGGAASPASSSGTSSSVQVTAWVDRAGGHLVGLDLAFPDIGAGVGTMSVDFFDFGATITVVVPVTSP